MPKLHEVLAEALSLNEQIKKFLNFSTYTEYSGMDDLDMDSMDGEQLFLMDELKRFAYFLTHAQERIVYLTRPVKKESILRERPDGKYQTESGHVFEVGSGIEALVTSRFRAVPYWARTIVDRDVDYKGEDYYLLDFEDLPMEGLRVRER